MQDPFLPTGDPQLDTLSRRFLLFADEECRDYAPVYGRIARGIAADPGLLAMAAQARPGQAVPNLFLATIHFLLLQEPAHPLGAFYPSVSGLPVPNGDPCPLVHAFCAEHRDDLLRLVSTRLVQTNELRRCAFLLPAFVTIARQSRGKPLALVEVGSSAGLNLLFDRYAYDYGAGRLAGDPNAPVLIATEVVGDIAPPLPAKMPAVMWRAGIDLNPISPTDAEQVLWLRALVWPEHLDRAAQLEAALLVASTDPPSQVACDALKVLPGVVRSAPRDAALCIFNTYTAFPPEVRERYRALIAELARERDLYWVHNQGLHELRLVTFRGGVPAEQLLARQHPHGAWVEWLEPAPAL